MSETTMFNEAKLMGEVSLFGVVILLLLLILFVIFILSFIFRFLSHLKEVQWCAKSKDESKMVINLIE